MPRATPSSDTIPFIVTTPARQSVEEKRKLIRSHVMRGKNRKKPRSMPPSWTSSAHPNLSVSRRKDYTLSIPVKVGGGFSFPASSVELPPDVLESIWKLKHAMSPIELNTASDQSESSWLEPIWNDAACLHFTVYIAKAYMDFVQGHNTNSKTGLAHFVTALTILQQRLARNNDLLSTSDSTILVVVGLTMAATALGDLDAAQKHLEGLHKMVTLRKGIADLGVALSTGSRGLFFSDNNSWNSCIALQGTLVSGTNDAIPDPSSDLRPFLDNLDTRVRLLWDHLSALTQGVNQTRGQSGIDKDLYQSTMISIHYRLVDLRFDAGDVNEISRLGLLAFASTVFLAFRGIKTRYEYLAESLKTSLSLLGARPGLPAKITLWLYTVGAVAIFDEHERAFLQPALTEVLRALELESWSEVRESLKSVLWLDALDDIAAEQMAKDMLRKF